MSQLKSSSIKEGATAGAVRKLLMGLTAFVVLSVSAYGTVIYIQLMNKVFPTGPLLIACYLGAAASLVLMLVLLVGKFLWFRPGAHEVASWLVTLVELAVAILNMILAFQLAGDPNPAHLSSILSAWYFFAPVSPVLSMVGATILLMTSSELRSKHHAMEIEEEKEKSRLDFDLSMHRAEMDVKTKYLGFVQTHLTNELNDPARQLEMKSHASALVADVLSGISGMPSVPRLPALDVPSIVTGTLAPPASLPAPRAGERPRPPKTESDDLDNGDGWLARVNARIEQERAQRLQQATPTTEAHEDGIVTGTMIPGGEPPPLSWTEKIRVY